MLNLSDTKHQQSLVKLSQLPYQRVYQYLRYYIDDEENMEEMVFDLKKTSSNFLDVLEVLIRYECMSHYFAFAYK